MVSGWNCTAQSALSEMRLTKERYRKTDGRQYYHFVQSFAETDDLTPQEAHAIGLELAQREFPDFEVLVATHIDTDHLHSHLIVNSVSFQNGKKLHQSAADLQAHRLASDEICLAHGLDILPPPQKQVKQKRMGSREYRSAAKGESWKLRLMDTIDQCMRFAASKEEFISLMESEGYTGALVNHRSETNGGKVKRLSPSEWYRHESFFPVIVPREQWEAVQRRMKEQARPANGNKAKHRYAGLLTCQECGNPFVPMIRYWRGNQRVEYVCRGYHRNGKSYCSSHRIHEETLDTMVWEYLTAVRDSHVKEQEQIVKLQKMWALRKPILDAHILALQERIQQLEGEIDGIVMERISQCHFNIGDLSTEAADKSIDETNLK